MAKLDINSDGVLNLLDDANRDGVLNAADLDAAVNIGRSAAAGVVDLGLGSGTDGVATFSIGGLPPGVDIGSIGIGPDPDETPTPGIIPNPDVNPGPVPDVTDLSDTLGNLSDQDVATLKIKCPNVLANPNAFSATTVIVCKTLASL